MFCKYCGNKIDDNASICNACGKKLTDDGNMGNVPAGNPAEKPLNTGNSPMNNPTQRPPARNVSMNDMTNQGMPYSGGKINKNIIIVVAVVAVIAIAGYFAASGFSHGGETGKSGEAGSVSQDIEDSDNDNEDNEMSKKDKKAVLKKLGEKYKKDGIFINHSATLYKHPSYSEPFDDTFKNSTDHKVGSVQVIEEDDEYVLWVSVIINEGFFEGDKIVWYPVENADEALEDAGLVGYKSTKD